MNRNVGLAAVGVTGAAGVVLGSMMRRKYRQDMEGEVARLTRLGSHVVHTAFGATEYADIGQGYPVLVIHGLLGGFDQGLLPAQDFTSSGYRAIVPSRFGYLRTAMPENASTAAQADAYASLLDAIGIKKAAVVAMSAGGVSGIQFALRHPDRCSALVLMSSVAPGETESELPPKQLAQRLLGSDFVFWLMTTYFGPGVNSVLGVPEGFKASPEQKIEIAHVRETLLPASQRSDGTLFDLYVSNPDINRGFPLQNIMVPVLVVSAQDDPLTRYEHARTMADKIPGAELLTIKDGGHLLLGHDAEVQDAVTSFLEKHARTEAQKKEPEA